MPGHGFTNLMSLRRCVRRRGPLAALLAAMLAYIALPLLHPPHPPHPPTPPFLHAHAHGHAGHGHGHAAARGHDHEGGRTHDAACAHAAGRAADEESSRQREPSPPPHEEHDCQVCVLLALGRTALPVTPALRPIAPEAPPVEAFTPLQVRPRSFTLADAPTRGPPAL